MACHEVLEACDGRTGCVDAAGQHRVNFQPGSTARRSVGRPVSVSQCVAQRQHGWHAQRVSTRLVAEVVEVVHGPFGWLDGDADSRRSEVAQGWTGLIRVDGSEYNWMGNDTDVARVEQISLEYTSTKTIFTMNVDDKIEMVVTFLSPVYYDDLRRQSVTSSYLNVAIKSRDDNTHTVQVYCDVSGGANLSPK